MNKYFEQKKVHSRTRIHTGVAMWYHFQVKTLYPGWMTKEKITLRSH